MIDGNKLGDAGFQYLGVPYSKMDCQAFVEQCLRDCGINKNLAGSNAWFREVRNNGVILTPEECVKQLGCVPKGAFLFILSQDGGEPEKYRNDGLGNASHIGIVTMPRGEGAIHSSASKGCVCESVFKGKTVKNGGWNRVGLWDKVAYDYGKSEPSAEPSDPVQEPAEETAVVVASKGKDVNLRRSPSMAAALVDRVPIGDTVTVNDRGDTWSKISWKRKTGWMMTKFLSFDDQEETYTAVIEGLTYDQAQGIREMFPDAIISAG